MLAWAIGCKKLFNSNCLTDLTNNDLYHSYVMTANITSQCPAQNTLIEQSHYHQLLVEHDLSYPSSPCETIGYRTSPPLVSSVYTFFY